MLHWAVFYGGALKEREVMSSVFISVQIYVEKIHTGQQIVLGWRTHSVQYNWKASKQSALQETPTGFLSVERDFLHHFPKIEATQEESVV
jgi:hypothetical protein